MWIVPRKSSEKHQQCSLLCLGAADKVRPSSVTLTTYFSDWTCLHGLTLDLSHLGTCLVTVELMADPGYHHLILRRHVLTVQVREHRHRLPTSAAQSPPWRAAKAAWTWPWAACPGGPCLCKGLGQVGSGGPHQPQPSWSDLFCSSFSGNVELGPLPIKLLSHLPCCCSQLWACIPTALLLSSVAFAH